MTEQIYETRIDKSDDDGRKQGKQSIDKFQPALQKYAKRHPALRDILPESPTDMTESSDQTEILVTIMILK